MGQTFCELKAATTLSAPRLSANTICAVTEGYDFVILHWRMSPPVGLNAASMSSAVVPGAKLLPMTTQGPDARPLIFKPGPCVFVRSVLSIIGRTPDSRRLSRVCRVVVGFACCFFTPADATR